jgi:hypothetical protein
MKITKATVRIQRSYDYNNWSLELTAEHDANYPCETLTEEDWEATRHEIERRLEWWIADYKTEKNCRMIIEFAEKTFGRIESCQAHDTDQASRYREALGRYEEARQRLIAIGKDAPPEKDAPDWLSQPLPKAKSEGQF